MEEWLLTTDKVCEALELERVPDYSTLAYAHKRLLKIGQLRQMNHTLPDKLELE